MKSSLLLSKSTLLKREIPVSDLDGTLKEANKLRMKAAKSQKLARLWQTHQLKCLRESDAFVTHRERDRSPARDGSRSLP